MNNKAKGVVAELAVAHELARRGFGVAWPVGDNEQYDLIVTSLSGKLYRVQVKSAKRNRQNSYRVGFVKGVGGTREPYSIHDTEVLVVRLPYDEDYPDLSAAGYYVIPVSETQISKGIFYPPGKGRYPQWVCKYEEYRDNWGVLK